MLITVRDGTNQSQIPALTSVLIRKKTVSFDPHRDWAGMGGCFVIPTKALVVWANLPSIGRWPSVCEWTPKRVRVRPQGRVRGRGLLPSFRRGSEGQAGFCQCSGTGTVA